MVLVRIAYAADLPTPDEVIRSLGEHGARRLPARRAMAARRSPGTKLRTALRRAARLAAFLRRGIAAAG